jgi:hypothetical protein
VVNVNAPRAELLKFNSNSPIFKDMKNSLCVGRKLIALKIVLDVHPKSSGKPAIERCIGTLLSLHNRCLPCA